MDRSLRCDVIGLLTEGGWNIPWPCGKAATVRYRPANDPNAPWSYRCADCAKWSDPSLVTVEEIGGQS